MDEGEQLLALLTNLRICQALTSSLLLISFLKVLTFSSYSPVFSAVLY